MKLDIMTLGEHGVSGKIVLDSISPEGIRLTTIHVRYPRMIHSELMTHRVFSRNGRSSRAVPVKTLLMEEVYTPHFMKNKPGMVAVEELGPYEQLKAKAIWEDLAAYTKEAVRQLSELEVHKQWANRPLEAFGFIDVLISSTDWANFFALRDEDGAQPEIRAVAEIIGTLLETSEPKELQPGEWHLPYITEEDLVPVNAHVDGMILPAVLGARERVIEDLLKKVSVARCARLTIKPFDGDGSIEKELARYEKLMVSRPVHASPAEHVATPEKPYGRENRHEWGNFFAWRQFRKMIPDNTILDR